MYSQFTASSSTWTRYVQDSYQLWTVVHVTEPEWVSSVVAQRFSFTEGNEDLVSNTFVPRAYDFNIEVVTEGASIANQLQEACSVWVSTNNYFRFETTRSTMNCTSSSTVASVSVQVSNFLADFQQHCFLQVRTFVSRNQRVQFFRNVEGFFAVTSLNIVRTDTDNIRAISSIVIVVSQSTSQYAFNFQQSSNCRVRGTNVSRSYQRVNTCSISINAFVRRTNDRDWRQYRYSVVQTLTSCIQQLTLFTFVAVYATRNNFVTNYFSAFEFSNQSSYTSRSQINFGASSINDFGYFNTSSRSSGQSSVSIGSTTEYETVVQGVTQSVQLSSDSSSSTINLFQVFVCSEMTNIKVQVHCTIVVVRRSNESSCRHTVQVIQLDNFARSQFNVQVLQLNSLVQLVSLVIQTI